MLAIVESYRAGLLQSKNWLNNIIAGVIVGIVALPLAMAFAIASGAKPEERLYTAIVAGIIVGLAGGSRVQIAGPTGAFVVILASITAQYGMGGLQIASFMAGFILIAMGLMQLGSVIKFIPEPVIAGFTSGIGFIIFVGEWKNFFGLPIHLQLGIPFYKKVYLLIEALPSLHWQTTILACISLAIILLTPKVSKRIPGPLLAMVFATSLQAYFHYPLATLGSTFGGIPQHLPHFHFPALNYATMVQLASDALTIALLGAIESLLSATAADGMAGTRHHSNQELIGQGLANIFAPLFGGFAATGAIARTATNIRNGGNSPISAIVHSLFLLGVLLLLAPLAANIPLYVLAAILFVVSYNMSDVPHFIYMLKRAPAPDILVLLITFLVTIFINLVIAVSVGVILALLLFMRRTNQAITIEEQPSQSLAQELQHLHIKKIPEHTMIYSIQGPFFFGAAEKIERALSLTSADPKVVILRLKEVPFIDLTGLETLKEILEQYVKRGITIYLCEANTKVSKKLAMFGILEYIAEKQLFVSLAEVLLVLQKI